MFHKKQYSKFQKLKLRMQQIILPSIWSVSPCTLPYSNRAPSFEKSRRFEVNSIYYKDDPHKPKNQQSILARPEMILHEFRKKIKEATKTYQSAVLKKKKSEQQENKQSFMNPKASEVTGRLYRFSNVLLMKYDFNGNRSSFFEDANKNEKQSPENHQTVSPKKLKQMKMHHKSCDNVYITGTPRTDFGRPLNFHPGPGSYFITENQNLSFLKNRSSMNSKDNSIEKKVTDMNKSMFTEKSKMETTSNLKKTLDQISKRYSVVDTESSPQKRKNLIVKKLRFFNKKD